MFLNSKCFSKTSLNTPRYYTNHDRRTPETGTVAKASSTVVDFCLTTVQNKTLIKTTNPHLYQRQFILLNLSCKSTIITDKNKEVNR